jgi:hypothetical protein
MLSRELQLGKAAEHLVCCDLILQGHNAMLADQGMPFDVLVIDERGRLCRVQVKASSKPMITARNPKPHYRFGLRHARGRTRVMSGAEVDVVAFVALDRKLVAYLPIAGLLSAAHGGMVQAVDLYAGEVRGRTYASGTTRALWGRRLDDHVTFPGCGERQVPDYSG